VDGLELLISFSFFNALMLFFNAGKTQLKTLYNKLAQFCKTRNMNQILMPFLYKILSKLKLLILIPQMAPQHR